MFLSLLAGIAYFAMRPAWVNAGRTLGLPPSLAQWLNTHDNLSNFLAYAILGGLALALPFQRKPVAPRQRMFHLLWNNTNGRAALLAGFVMMLEVSQLWIPGRIFDWVDVLCGWGGLLTIWSLRMVVLRLMSARL